MLQMSNLIKKESECIRMETIWLRKIILILLLTTILIASTFLKLFFFTTWPIYISYSGTSSFHTADLIETININSPTTSINQFTYLPGGYSCVDVRKDKFRVNLSTNEFEDVVYEFDTKLIDQGWLIWYHSGWSPVLSVNLGFSVPNFAYDKISTKSEGFNATIMYKNNPLDVWKTFSTLDPSNKVHCYQSDDPIDADSWQCILSVFKSIYLISGKIYQLSVHLPRQARPASATFIDNPSTMTDIELTMEKESKCIFTLYYHPVLLPLLAIGAFMCLCFMTRRGPRLSLLQNTICFGGLLILLNNDIEYLWTLNNFPWILFWIDLKKIIFHGGFMMFMIIFVGEHIADDKESQRKHQLCDYWRSLITVTITTFVLFLYHAWENEYRAWNPFSIIQGLTDPFPTPFIVVIALEVMYLLYLTFAVGKAMMSVKKKRALPGVITSGQELSNNFRYNAIFVMYITWNCLVLTVLEYITMKLSHASKVTELNIIINYPHEALIVMCIIWVCYFVGLSYLYSSDEISWWIWIKHRLDTTMNDEKKLIPNDEKKKVIDGTPLI